MKFLIDAQIPKKLALFLKENGYDAIHTSELPDRNRTRDREINRISMQEKRVLITKDADFIESILISDKPYKLIYLSTGNITNRALMELFMRHLDEIVEMIDRNRLVELSDSSLIIRM